MEIESAARIENVFLNGSVPIAPSRFGRHTVARAGLCRVVAIPLFLLAVSLRADIGVAVVSADLDAELARAADLLESGRRAEAEQVLAEIRRKSGQPAWDARAAFLLAADDERQKAFAEAARRLKDTPAAVVGLEPYRQMRLARVLEGAGRSEEALAEYRNAFATEEGFAMRVAVGRALAAALLKLGDTRGASRVLSDALAAASASELVAITIERVRLGRQLKDSQAVRNAARDLLLRGTEPSSGLPVFVRAALAGEEARLSSAERGRLGRSLVANGDVRHGVRLLEQTRRSLWPPGELGQNLLALAQGQARLGNTLAAEKIAAEVPQDATETAFEAKLLRADLYLARLHKKRARPLLSDDPLLTPARRAFLALSVPGAPVSVRASARERLVKLACEAGLFEEGLEHARALTQESPGTVSGFEPLWRLAWERYLLRDFADARRRFEALSGVYGEIGRRRRLAYWRARCLEREGRPGEATLLFESLAAGDPADLYALFARRHSLARLAQKPSPLTDPSAATATFRRTDELLRLRMFEEAAAEAGLLLPSRGRDLRLAQAEFALGRFLTAAAAAKRAFPEIGTSEEGRVPDGWRRLFYPIEEGGFLVERARESGLDPALLRGLVRQESVFEPKARSRAGALGLTQLMPSTARSLSRSVLRVRYRRAFLYDPGVNAKLGAAYLKSLLDRFGGKTLYALAAYNGGPTRMARLLQENPGRDEEEIFESHPVYETRDYVRRVTLFAESYRALYP